MTRLYGDWYQSYAELPHFFLALKRSNLGWIMYLKTVLGNNSNDEIFHRVFWAFSPFIKGFTHCRPLLSIDGTHICMESIKGKWWLVWGVMVTTNYFHLLLSLQKVKIWIVRSWFLACIRVGVTQRKGLCLISDHHLGIIAAIKDTYLGWTKQDAYHIFCTHHLASNFNTRLKNKTFETN